MKYAEVANLSAAQKNKLKKGNQIQLNPKKHKSTSVGMGMPLLVNEANYNAITKSFDNNKGIRFKLSTEEIEANSNVDGIKDTEARELIQGSGLFAGSGNRSKKKRKIAKKIERLKNQTPVPLCRLKLILYKVKKTKSKRE